MPIWPRSGASSAQRGTPIARAVMSNLVVFRDRIAPPTPTSTTVIADLPLDDVARPSSVAADRDRARRRQPTAADAPFAAGVGIVDVRPGAAHGTASSRSWCDRPAPRRRCRRSSAASSAAICRPRVWWTEDLSAVPPLDALVTMGRQLRVRQPRSGATSRGARARARAAASGGRHVDLADRELAAAVAAAAGARCTAGPGGTPLRCAGRARAHRPRGVRGRARLAARRLRWRRPRGPR